jgi:Phosphotransferase enzyme family
VSARAERKTEDLAGRATALWVDAEPGGSFPESVETLKEPHRKSAVLRLLGAGSDGQPVVAKRAVRSSIEIEARVYRDVLARLPVSATRLLAKVPDGERAWLFLEDAGETPFDSKLDTHRRLAAIWMARVHGGARRLPAVKELPDRGPGHYFDLLRSVEALLAETLGNPALSAEEIAVVEEVVEACDRLGSQWSSVAAKLAEGPLTITFGGFSSKNARVREGPDEPVLMPFDFESAGYGCPAIDLVYLDGDPYVQEAREWWSGLDVDEFDRLRGVGRILGGLKAIPGERKVLLGPAPSKAVAKLRWYGLEIVGGMSEA